ncbi:hypothetical protein [Burkholderia gladioli]|uniref:hypothetical protein n=1 Tax=Burkholderia gladioli TaxID=28095 RepID=UPI001C5CF333|nr:hypothetical protein [Burkholderia gladioli]MBW5284192.1 hypothetical protein [Burkholderia gladioli]
MKKRLYLEGHNHTRGYVVSLELFDAPPVRYYQCHPDKVRSIIERFNRRCSGVPVACWRRSTVESL